MKFVRELENGFFLTATTNAVAPEGGAQTDRFFNLGGTLSGIVDDVDTFCGLVLDLEASTHVAADDDDTNSIAAATAATTAQSTFLQGIRGLKTSFHGRLSSLLTGLNALNRSTHPNAPLLSRLRAVEFWDRHIEVSF